MAGKAQHSIDHYQVLNVAPDAPLEGIRAAYRTAVLQLHPDKAGADYGQEEWQRNEEFIRVQQAWEVLKNAQTRASYNQLLLAQALQKELAVSAEVDLDDMVSHDNATGTFCTFTYPCRCGSTYTLSEADLSEKADNVLIIVARMGNPKEEKALEEKNIHPGDFVSTRYRGGTREGVVERIATTTDEHPHPPKVIFTNQRGKEVAHNPSTLEKKAAAEQHDKEGDE